MSVTHMHTHSELRRFDDDECLCCGTSRAHVRHQASSSSSSRMTGTPVTNTSPHALSAHACEQVASFETAAIIQDSCTTVRVQLQCTWLVVDIIIHVAIEQFNGTKHGR